MSIRQTIYFQNHIPELQQQDVFKLRCFDLDQLNESCPPLCQSTDQPVIDQLFQQTDLRLKELQHLITEKLLIFIII